MNSSAIDNGKYLSDIPHASSIGFSQLQRDFSWSEQKTHCRRFTCLLLIAYIQNEFSDAVEVLLQIFMTNGASVML